MTAALLIAALLPVSGAPAQNVNTYAITYAFPISPAKAASFSQGGHAYQAVDIFAPEGTAFVAPVAGVIEDLGTEDRWDPRTQDPSLKGGRWVSLIGKDGFRYYGSHLASVAGNLRKGQEVEAGTALGMVGRAGNARGTPPHLHFGISLASRPYSWKVRRGEIDPVPMLKCLLSKSCDPAVLPK
jgi:peptidoglycan LD-endopeptidase LytH